MGCSFIVTSLAVGAWPSYSYGYYDIISLALPLYLHAVAALADQVAVLCGAGSGGVQV